MKYIRSCLKNKKIIISAILLLLTIVTLIVVFAKKNITVEFSLVGDQVIELELNELYEEPGYQLLVNGQENNRVTIKNNIDNTKIGEYHVKYTYIDSNRKKHILERIIKIVDRTPPEIILKGETTINLLLNESYTELGYEVKDNYDVDVVWEDIIQITNNIDTSKEGEYFIEYCVEDSSGNKTTVTRTIIVTKPKKVKAVSYTENKSQESKTNKNNLVNDVDNTILNNQFTADGIYLEGYVNNNNGTFKIQLNNGENNYEYEMTAFESNKYKGNINLTGVSDGTYEVNIISSETRKLINKLSNIERIFRAKVGEKLITVNYDNQNDVTIKVEPFSYQYDILIDVGHGGSDPGASNVYVYEKDMNLTISKYEKCRYEEHGLNVFMTRENDSYGVVMGDNNWKQLTRRSYAIGYYGSVSQIVYSNHHNSSTSAKLSGYEILTPAKYNTIQPELSIAANWQNLYPLQETHKRVYARDYDSGTMYSTQNSETYNFVDYYAVIRVPYLLFNTKVVIYEGIYLSNIQDYNWYWNNANWKKASEVKIKEYVQYLGKDYIESTNCQ